MAIFNKRIPLNKPMNYDDRDVRFSQVNSKWVDKPNVLFPAADFDIDALANSFMPLKIVLGDNNVYAVGEDSSNGVAVYLFNTVTFTETLLDSNGSGTRNFEDVVFYNDGTDPHLYGLDDVGDLWKYNIDTDTFSSNIQTIGSAGQQMMGYHSQTDSIYPITNNAIYSQTGTTFNATPLKTLPTNFTFRDVHEYRTYLVLVAESDESDEIRALFYDVINTPSTFEKTPLVGKGRILASGVVNDRLLVAIYEEYKGNKKEYQTIITLKYYNGSGFTELNKLYIKGTITTNNVRSSTDGDYLYVGVNDSDLEQSGVFRFDEQGEIKILGHDVDMGSTGQYYHVLSTDGFLIAALDEGSSIYRIATLVDKSNTLYNDFNDRSIYITPFMEDPYENKAMTSIYMSFVKTVDNSEIGKIDYRLSKADSWTNILSFERDNFTSEQNRFMVNFDDSNPLPEFKEIQFRITSVDGLNITSAGYKGDYIDDDAE